MCCTDYPRLARPQTTAVGCLKQLIRRFTRNINLSDSLSLDKLGLPLLAWYALLGLFPNGSSVLTHLVFCLISQGSMNYTNRGLVYGTMVLGLG